MKHTLQIELFLHARQTWDNNTYYSTFQTDMSGEEGFGIVVSTKTIDVDFEIPDDFNMNAEIVKSLRKEKKKIQAETQIRLNEIEDKIQRLLCIEHK